MASHHFAAIHMEQMLTGTLVTGLLYAGLQQVTPKAHLCEMLTTEMITAISEEQVTLASSKRYREAAAEVVLKLKTAAESGSSTFLLLPLHCPEPKHYVAGVLDMCSGNLQVFDSFDKDVTFMCAPVGGGVPAFVASKVQVWQEWFEHIGAQLVISFDISSNYHCLNQQDDGWRCGL